MLMLWVSQVINNDTSKVRPATNQASLFDELGMTINYLILYSFLLLLQKCSFFTRNHPPTVFHPFTVYLILVMVFLKGTRSALALRDASTDSETFLQNLDALLTWVCEIEELTANQKPPSSEVKVVKAQLQEQKVCYHRHHITSFLVSKNIFEVPQ